MIGAAITFVATVGAGLIGVVVSALLAERRARTDETRALERARLDRERADLISGIEATQLHFERRLMYAGARVIGDRQLMEKNETNEADYPNRRVAYFGDSKLLDAALALLDDLAKRPPGSGLPIEEQARLRNVRGRVRHALQEQRTRANAGKPLVLIPDDELERLTGAEAEARRLQEIAEARRNWPRRQKLRTRRRGTTRRSPLAGEQRSTR